MSARPTIGPIACRVRHAAAEDLPAAADTLASAFAAYPWTRHVIPDDGYLDRLRALQFLYLGHAYRHGVVGIGLIADGVPPAGVTALLPPDAPEPTPEVMAEIITLHGDRVDRLGPAAGAPQGHDEPHDEPNGADASAPWRLETLGVHPDHQGAGLGGALLEFGLDTAARRGAREITLETSDARNVRLYERYGFTIVAEPAPAGSTPTDAPPVWRMAAHLGR